MTKKSSDKKIGFLIGGGALLVLFIWMGITLGSLVSKSHAIYIYNPHEDVLTIEIGESQYFLKAYENRKIDLFEDNYNVKSILNNEVIVDTAIHLTFLMKEKGGLLNLSGEPMYLWTEYYGSPTMESLYNIKDSSMNSASPLNQVREQGLSFFQIDSTILYGNIKVYECNEIVLEKEWFYNIDQAFENEISTNEHSDIFLGKPISKLFDKNGLLTYWNENNNPTTLGGKYLDPIQSPLDSLGLE